MYIKGRIKTWSRNLLFFSLTVFFTSCSYFIGNKEAISEEGVVFIPGTASFSEVMDSLSPYLVQPKDFERYAVAKDFREKIKPGKYRLQKGEKMKDLLRKLVFGEQEEVILMIRNEPTLFHLAGSVSKMIEPDSAQIAEAMLKWAVEKDSAADAETAKMYFIPNTYHFYWTTSAEAFAERMGNEFDKVWNENRQEQAEKMEMTPLEVYTLASIVQMEASNPEEQKKVARAYLNRLAMGKKLEADPTSVYAYKLQNGFNHKIQRVKLGHLVTPSEYNTYRVKGLPPAPICLPNTSAVDAVLHPDDHEFIYFCADPERPGMHSFTNSYKEHLQNAAKYRKWLEEKGIH